MNRRVALGAVAGVVVGSPTRQLAGTWRSGPAVPTPRSEVAAATAGGAVYVLGGLAEDGSTVSTVEALGETEMVWAAHAPLPQPRDHLGAVELDGRLWAIGGSPGWFNQQTSQTLWVYDSMADRWEDRAPLPLGRAAHAAAVVDGRILVAGGIGPEPERPLLYDPHLDRWSFIAPLSRPREHVAAAGIGATLYLVGGRWGDVGNVALLEAYDALSDRWRALPSMPTARGGLAAAALNGRLWVTGGEVLDDSRVTFPQLEIFDPVTGTWESAVPTPTGRHGLAAAVRDGELYVLAGGRLAGLDVSGVTEICTPIRASRRGALCRGVDVLVEPAALDQPARKLEAGGREVGFGTSPFAYLAPQANQADHVGTLGRPAVGGADVQTRLPCRMMLHQTLIEASARSAGHDPCSWCGVTCL